VGATKRFVADQLERAVRTFAQGFAAAFVLTDLNVVSALKVAVGAGLASVAMSYGAKHVGAKGTAALLPVTADAASAVLDTTGRVVGSITEPVPVVKQVGDAVEEGVDVLTDKVQDAAAAGARAVEGFLGRLFRRRKP
jgi:hypothetical protein